MRKLALAIVLVLVLVGSVVGGVVAANGASPTLSVSGGSSAPSRVSISGKSWTPAVQVNLYMDTTADEAHHVAFATPDSRGSFLASFALGPAELGPHEIIGVQNGTEVHAAFTITNTQQVDDRTGDVLNAIDEEVGNIEGKLDDPTTGLAEIKSEVAAIETKLDQGVAIIESYSGSAQNLNPGDNVEFSFGEIRHVSLTLYTTNDGGYCELYVNFPSIPGLRWPEDIILVGWMTTHEFDTDAFSIVRAGSSTLTLCAWNMTTTKPLPH